MLVIATYQPLWEKCQLFFLSKQILSLAMSKNVIQQAESLVQVSSANHEQKPQDLHASPEPNKKVINHLFSSQDKSRL